MRFSVSVPVLSEPMTVVLPSVSTACRRRTSALRFAIALTRSASVMVSTIGSPSGTAATATPTTTLNMSTTLLPTASPSAKMTAQPTPTTMPMMCAKRRMRCCSGVSSTRCSRMLPAILPSSVCAPVATT
jgi:hypothetical protein